MKTSRAKISLTVGTLVALAVATGILYAANLSPFKNQAEVEATDICPPLGRSSHSVDALNEVLPDASSYSFDHQVNPRLDDSDSSYESSCFASGDGDQLLTAKAVLIQKESPENWVAWVKGTAADRESVTTLHPFSFGDSASASSRFAAASIACTGKGKIPGGAYNLSISVELKKAGDVENTTARAHLIELVKSSATYAVKAAKCNIPLKLNVG
ncbi:hypothetical protein [Streptomyces sp. DH24]|uniref:hypothetical protein n=1 Tax=Streptomyces sp. DH24 TaxID=3040123 RepID=UPI002442217B|nr:hypothetical protein [Streptomyces sp. DH24]MDG9720078.1 hypothetical protein [Streptomyces sp. DH24]